MEKRHNKKQSLGTDTETGYSKHLRLTRKNSPMCK